MIAGTKSKPTASIIRKLTFNLVLTISLLLAALAVSIGAGSFILGSQKTLDEQKAQVTQDVDGLLRSMINQETGVRGYINTNDSSFLDPYNQGRTDYLNYTQDLENLSRRANPPYEDTLTALRQVESQADDWYRNSAEVEVARMQRGDLTYARAEQTARDSKTRFDNFRQSVATLQQKTALDLAQAQQDTDRSNLFILAITLVIAALAVLFIWIAFNRFIARLRSQLDGLMAVTSRLEDGDLSVRVSEPSGDELGRLGQNFNNMALALEQQQSALKQRDIQDSVLLLGNSLNNSLDLEPLLENFLSQLLNLLHIEVGTLYLYNPQTNLLTIGAALGADRSQLQPLFGLGEGMVGRVAQTRQPLLSGPDEENNAELANFEIKTIYGSALPRNLLHLPIVRGGDLLGVLVVGTFQELSENSRNVLSVVSGNLATAISNAQAFRHIQNQAEELERRKHELERSNEALSHQRDELTVLNSALEEANRLRNQFLSTMSHELRTPLTAIIGFSQLMLRGQEVKNLSARQKSNLERILNNGQQLLGLVNDVLDIAKIEAGRMDLNRNEVEIASLLNGVIEQTQSLATQKGLSLKAEIPENAGKLDTDPDKLRQVLLNLISNAIKFTEKGGVTLRVSLDAARPGYQGGEQERIAIAVSDTGIGIPTDKLNHIFDEFYQVDSSSTRRYGGTGLGLSIVRKLADLLGGTIQVQSTPGQGSTFTINLPRHLRQTLTPPTPPTDTERQFAEARQAALEPLAAEDQHSRPAALPTLLPPLEDGKRLVLAIDDDPDIIELIHASLENTSYQVVGLTDPTLAAERVAELHPYAVTLDVMMPGSNGWQVLQQLKSDPTTAGVPVIMLTVVSDRSAGYVLGANDYLTKPIDREVLLRTLNRLMLRQEVGAGSNGNRGYNGGRQNERSSYVLIVDDDADIRTVLEQTLSEAGQEVKTAAGGLEALDLARQYTPGAILLDLMMPDLDGFEVLSRLRAQPATATTPVVVLTAKSLNSQDYERLRWGANRVIQKGSLPLPRLLEELNQTLQSLSKSS